MKQSYVGEIIHNQTTTRLYQCWKNMKSRCYSKSSDRYNAYGARGIEVCTDWFDFSTFFKWATENGYNENLTIDTVYQQFKRKGVA